MSDPMTPRTESGRSWVDRVLDRFEGLSSSAPVPRTRTRPEPAAPPPSPPLPAPRREDSFERMLVMACRCFDAKCPSCIAGDRFRAAIEAEAVAAWLRSPEAEEALARALHDEFWDESVPREEGERCCRPSAARLLRALRGESDG